MAEHTSAPRGLLAIVLIFTQRDCAWVTQLVSVNCSPVRIENHTWQEAQPDQSQANRHLQGRAQQRGSFRPTAGLLPKLSTLSIQNGTSV